MRRLFSTARAFARLSRSRREIVVEALVDILAVRLLVWRRGQHHAIAASTRRARHDEPIPGVADDDDVAREVRWAIARIATVLRHQRNPCLVQAIAGSRMLSRRGVRWTLRIGVGRNAEALVAHAWLLCGRCIVTGGAGVRTITPLATYVKPQ